MAGPKMRFGMVSDVKRQEISCDDDRHRWDNCFKTSQDPEVNIVEKIVEKIKIVEKLIQPKWENVQGSDEEISEFEKACILCMTNKPQCVLLPCMHSGFCIACSNHLKKEKKCPLCRNHIDTPKKLYAS